MMHFSWDFDWFKSKSKNNIHIKPQKAQTSTNPHVYNWPCLTNVEKKVSLQSVGAIHRFIFVFLCGNTPSITQELSPE